MIEGLHASMRLWHEGGVDPLLRGMLSTEGKPAGEALNEGFSDSVREKLFQLNQEISSDLVSLNIQRGRDHGLARFWEYRKHVARA